jgi:hypothetical protein
MRLPGHGQPSAQSERVTDSVDTDGLDAVVDRRRLAIGLPPKPLTRCIRSSLRATLHRRLLVAAIGFVGRHPLRLTFIAHQAH